MFSFLLLLSFVLKERVSEINREGKLLWMPYATHKPTSKSGTHLYTWGDFCFKHQSTPFLYFIQTDHGEGNFFGSSPLCRMHKVSATDLVPITQRSPPESVVNSKEVHTGDCRLKSWLQSCSTPCAVQMCTGRRKGLCSTAGLTQALSHLLSFFSWNAPSSFSPNFLLCSSISSCPHSIHGLEAYTGAHKQPVISSPQGQHWSRRLQFISFLFVFV